MKNEEAAAICEEEELEEGSMCSSTTKGRFTWSRLGLYGLFIIKFMNIKRPGCEADNTKQRTDEIVRMRIAARLPQ